MSNDTFPGMTPELQAYVDHWDKEHTDQDAKYSEGRRLREQIPKDLYRAYHRFEIDQSFVDEKIDSRREKMSPSGKYKLVTASFGTKPGCWSYAQGRVYAAGSDTPIVTVNRNYSAFPNLFIEGHPNGHDYLVCGEDYQGQTVIELDTGKRRDFLPESADEGHGFCWGDYVFHADAKLLVVCGCYWACPYEFRFFDLSDPMAGWPELVNEWGADEDAKYPTIEPDGTIKTYQTESSDDDDEDDEKPVERSLAATKTFRREGLKLVLIEEWVSEKEQKIRADREEGHRKWEEWLETFRATDPLYLYVKEQVKSAPYDPDSYDSIGQTYDGWHPTLQLKERRMCRRIAAKKYPKIDLEWAHETGPIKLIVYKDAKAKAEDHWFDHSIEGMTAAFDYARSILNPGLIAKALNAIK